MMHIIGAERGNPNNEAIRYILVPGRGRTIDGMALTTVVKLRVVEAARVFKELELEASGGAIIVSGYKSPADRLGQRDIFIDGYEGVPEADLMKKVIVAQGVPEACVRTERDSIDSVTNLTFAEAGNYFIDNGAIAIVSQVEHLQRILGVIAPRTLRRPYIGVVAPESNSVDTDSMWATFFSRIALVGITPQTPDIAGITHRRVRILWRIANLARFGKPYKPEG